MFRANIDLPTPFGPTTTTLAASFRKSSVMSASTAARSQGFGQVQSKSQSGLKRPIWAAELSDGSQHVRTLEEAEIALRYLIKKMAVVDGHLVSAHPRFAYPRHQGQAAAEEVRAE